MTTTKYLPLAFPTSATTFKQGLRGQVAGLGRTEDVNARRLEATQGFVGATVGDKGSAQASEIVGAEQSLGDRAKIAAEGAETDAKRMGLQVSQAACRAEREETPTTP